MILQKQLKIRTIPQMIFFRLVHKLFPGYSGIVQYGHCSFLAMALCFAMLVDAFLVINFYWTALITSNQRNVLLVGLFGVWVLLTLVASYRKHQISSLQLEDHDEIFRQTICHYLRADWFAVETQILHYIKKHPKDIEMLLLQASMYRHSERHEEAVVVLDKLLLLQDSRYWCAEIESERALSNASKRPSDESTNNESDEEFSDDESTEQSLAKSGAIT